VELENDKVRVLRITYAPGEEAAMHEHPDAVLVNLSNFTVQFTLPDGVMPPAEPAQAGSVTWAAARQCTPRRTSAPTGQKPY
jgi:hypothetical protein